jgi:diguanylate cyclase (GGDEF)-like protein
MFEEFSISGQRAVAVKRRRAERTASVMMRLGHWAALFTIFGGVLILLAYAFGVERLFRPIAEAPASHPLTAVLFIVAGAAVASIRPFHVARSAVLVLLATALLSFVRLFEVAVGVNWVSRAAPFQETLAQDASLGVSMGWHAATMFLFVALAFLLRYLRFPKMSQVAAVVGIMPSLVSLTGYVYGVADLHGAMSLTTTIFGLAFAATPFLLGARTGIMRAISSPWDGGRYGRLQIVAAGSVLFWGGLLVQRTGVVGGQAIMPAFVVVAILVLSVTGAYCSVIIERNDYARRRAERKVAHLVLHDPLSGLYNRRFLEEQEEGIAAFAKRKGYGLCVLMLDLDHFKTVNDEFGHQVGDCVLRRFAEELKGRPRRGDIAVRYGGEEFLAVLLDVDLSTAGRVADDFRRMIEIVDFSDLGPEHMTVSIGVAPVLTSVSEAVSCADGALYDAKRRGRNRVVTAPVQRRKRANHLRLARQGG